MDTREPTVSPTPPPRSGALPGLMEAGMGKPTTEGCQAWWPLPKVRGDPSCPVQLHTHGGLHLLHTHNPSRPAAFPLIPGSCHSSPYLPQCHELPCCLSPNPDPEPGHAGIQEKCKGFSNPSLTS